MKFPLAFFLLTGLVCSQTKPAVSPDTVVCEVDGKKYTAADVEKVFASLPPDLMVQVRNDPKRSLSFILTARELAAMAVKGGLDKQSPTQERLEYQRMTTLSSAELDYARNNQVEVNPDDEKKFYREHPERFQEAKVRVIYIAFSNLKAADGAKKSLSEEEAKTKAEGLKKQLDAGGDFAKLAQENSDDKQSAEKGGDYGTIKRSSPYPDAIKNAVFSLKRGQVSEPIRQANGFYLLQVESVSVQPYDAVRADIYNELKQKGFSDWMQAIEKRFQVKVENSEYFTAKPTGPVPPAVR